MNHMELEGLWIDALENEGTTPEITKPKQMGCYAAWGLCPPIAFI